MIRALLLVLSACAANVHLEAGARHDTHGSALHAGVSLAIGIGEGNSVGTRHAELASVGADLDEQGGARFTTSMGYLGAGPGGLLYGARLSYLVGAGPRLGGSLLYIVHAHEREGHCLFDYEHDDCDARDVTIGAVGIQLSGTAEDNDPGVVTDIVFDLLE